jgi:hypothetical protein
MISSACGGGCSSSGPRADCAACTLIVHDCMCVLSSFSSKYHHSSAFELAHSLLPCPLVLPSADNIHPLLADHCFGNEERGRPWRDCRMSAGNLQGAKAGGPQPLLYNFHRHDVPQRPPGATNSLPPAISNSMPCPLPPLCMPPNRSLYIRVSTSLNPNQRIFNPNQTPPASLLPHRSALPSSSRTFSSLSASTRR